MPPGKEYPHLFRPGKIGTLDLKNRIVRAPCCTGFGGRDGSVTNRVLAHYRELARGGAGLVIVEYSYMDHKASKSAQCQLGIADNEHIPGLSQLAQSIQAEGAKAGIQIEHAGRQKFLGTPPIKAPSRIPWEELHEMGGSTPEELTFEEIQEIVEAWGDAVKRAQMAGFDFVEIHGAHGYLITNFLSPRTNKRTDWYGGSLENRMRFLLQVVANARKKVGRDFPLGVRLSGSEYEPDGVTIEETVQVAKALEWAGIDVIHISGGNHHTMHHQVSPLYVPAAHNVWAAEAVKRVVSVPVIASGSLNTPELGEEVLASGKGDFIGLGRVLFADPYFPAKAAAGRPQDITPCIRCNDGCLERSFFLYQAVRCAVNPSLGHEGLREIKPAETRLKIAVVGGGPAGMEAARVSALRGHSVTLFEKRRLGGMLIEASASTFKADLGHLLRYLTAQVERLGIKVVREEATPEQIAAGGFDHVIVAIGGELVQRHFPGCDRPHVVDACAVLRGEAPAAEQAVVVGGGLIGSEVALHLAEQGRRVTIATRRDDFMDDADDFGIPVELANKGALVELIEKYGVAVRTGMRLISVDEQGARFEDRQGRQEQLPAQTVVLSSGFRSQPGFLQTLQQLGVAATAIGDCVKPRKIFDAIHEGYLTALRLGDAAYPGAARRLTVDEMIVAD